MVEVEKLKIERKDELSDLGTRGPRWTRWAIALLLLLVIGFFLRDTLTAMVERMTQPEVRTQKIERKAPASAAQVAGASANGYIVARVRAALSADTPGRIVEMNVQEGSRVKRGDVVARLYSEEYAAALARSEADLALAVAGHTREEASVGVAERELARAANVEESSVAEHALHKATHVVAELEHRRAVELLASGVESAQRRDRTQADLDAAKARVRAAEAGVRTAASAKATAAAQLGVAQALVAEAKSRVEVAKASVALSKATYDKTFVRAPFDGVVVLKDAEVGEVVSPNVQGGSNARGSVVTMVDFSTLEVQAEVPETSLAAVAKDAAATIFLDAHPEQGYRGRVDRIWPTANRTKATVEVRVVFEAPDERLRPEMGVRVVFGSPERAPTDPAQRVIVIPEASLVAQDGRQGVLLLDVDTLRFAAVTLGERRSGKAIVTAGLEEGQELVLTPDAAWKPGMRVRRAAAAP